MSIVVLNDLVLELTDEGQKINRQICLFYLILNFVSVICCSIYLFIYHKIPYYQNHSNSLTLILTRINLVSNISYCLFFADLFFYNPTTLTTMIKILTMINPLIIFSFYFWCACITHNIYVTFYNYTNSLEKRIKFYKYQLIVYLFIFYICTLFSIRFKEKEIKSKSFSFIENYGEHYIILFYLIGLFILIYIICRLYFIIARKSQTFSLNSPTEKDLIKKKLFQSLVARHILFVFYFLITFVPINFMMILKYIFRLIELKNYYLSFITMTLLSFYATFIFIIKLTEPITRHFFLSFIMCNKEYIKEYEPLMRKDNANISRDENNDSLNEECERDILMHVYREYDKSFVTFYNQRQMLYVPSNLKRVKFTSFNLGNNYGLRFLPLEKKEMSKFFLNSKKTSSMKNIKSTKVVNKTNNLFYDSSVNRIEMLYYEDNGENDNQRNNENNNNINIAINIVSQEPSQENNNNTTDNEKRSKTIQINDTISEIKEEIIQVEDSAQTESKQSNQIKTNLSSSDNSKNVLFQRNFSRIHDEHMQNNLYPNPLSKSTSTNINTNNIRTSSFLQLDRTILEKKNTLGPIMIQKKYATNRLYIDPLRKPSEQLSNSHKSSRKFKSPIKSKKCLQEEISGYESLTRQIEVNDNLQRMMAISICINEDKKYDNQNKYQKYYYCPLPWKNTNFYKEKTPFYFYNESKFKEFLGIKDDINFDGFKIKIKEYCPFVFHHLRMMDKLTVDDILKSLDYKFNMDIINNSKVTGGRGDNSMFRTWDKKLIIKTISDDEKNLLINKMLEEYHSKMRDSKSILSHIYGVFKLELADKGQIIVMLQRNMNDLFIDSNVLVFDLKGSSVDRQTIKEEHKNLPQKDLINKYKNITLKDTDLDILKMRFELNPFDGNNILTSIYNDSMFLQKYDITDYSLLIFVNKYNKKNVEKEVGNYNIISGLNKDYVFNFSIIDFLGTFDLGKKSEKIMKEFIGVFKSSSNKNFSVQNPQTYGNRFRKYAKKIIIYEKEENDKDNFSS